MTCIKTGCVAYIEDFEQWVYGDAHSYGAPDSYAEKQGVLVIRAVLSTEKISELREFGWVRHFTVKRVAEWWDANKTSMNQNSSLISNPGNWINHGYDGIAEPRLTKRSDDTGIKCADGGPCDLG